jgi:hypothetical protein
MELPIWDCGLGTFLCVWSSGFNWVLFFITCSMFSLYSCVLFVMKGYKYGGVGSCLDVCF